MSRYATAHANPQGPGDARPTAAQIVRDENLVGGLRGKAALIVGVSAPGMGLECARALHLTGCDVFLTVRNQTQEQDVKRALSDCTGQSKFEFIQLDLNSLKAVEEGAKTFLSRSKQLNILITNAGVMCCPEEYTKEGFETHFFVNYLAHFYLFQLLQPLLLGSSTPSLQSRVVTLSSNAHIFSQLDVDNPNDQAHNRFLKYCQSKTADIYMALEIDSRYGPQGLHATSVHPGIHKSNLTRYMPQAVQDTWRNSPAAQARLKSSEQAAATVVWAAIGKDWEGKGGKYLEDCLQGQPSQPKSYMHGYAEHAYDTATARQLWEKSLQLVALC